MSAETKRSKNKISYFATALGLSLPIKSQLTQFQRVGLSVRFSGKREKRKAKQQRNSGADRSQRWRMAMVVVVVLLIRTSNGCSIACLLPSTLITRFALSLKLRLIRPLFNQVSFTTSNPPPFFLNLLLPLYCSIFLKM